MQIAAKRIVDQLHARADAEDRQAALGDKLKKHPSEMLPARIEQPEAGMEHVAVVARVEIGSADHDDAIELVENSVDVLRFAERRNDNRHASDGRNTVVIAGGNEGERRRIFL